MQRKDPILQIKNLKTYFPSGNTWFGKQQYIMAVNDVSFDINRNEIIGLVGESGSGKSVTALSIMRLIASPPAHQNWMSRE